MANPHRGFSATPVGRARPSAFDMNASTTSIGSMGGDAATADLLREQQIERDRLQMDNFNLMMRVAVLEERLANSQSTYTEDFEAELLQKRVEIEEKDAKIRQQKEHMIMAVAKLEQLQQELAEAYRQLELARTKANGGDELEMMRHVLAKTDEDLQNHKQRMREMEEELTNANDERVAFRARFEEASETKQRMEAELHQLRQKLQQMEQQQTKGVMQVEHLQSLSKRRDEQVEALGGRLEQASHEKQQLEAKYQAQMKRMEDQMRAQLEKLQQEGEKYRSEFTRASGERDKLQFERERFGVELDSVKQDKARYQAEWERLAKEIDRVNAEAESLRLQNVKLNATCEHQGQTLDSYKSERESAMDNLHKLETEANQWRKLSSEREVAVKTLEMRCTNAEAEVMRLQERLEAVTTRTQQSANERLAQLEQGKNAMESQNYELRTKMATLQHQLESFESKCQAYETRVTEESIKAKEYKERLLATEREMRQRIAHAEQLERQLAQVTNSSVTESGRVHQYSEQITRVTNERNQLMESLSTERARFEAIQKSHVNLETQNQQLSNQFEALAREIQGIVGFGVHELSYRTLDALLKEAKVTLQRNFNAEAEKLVRRWQEQAESVRAEVDRLSSQLHVCHSKIETLQRSTLHAKDDAKTVERSWMKKYESLRLEAEMARRSSEDALRSEKMRCAELEASLSHARNDLDAMAQARNGTLGDLERDIRDLKESNRLLLGELQERRRAAEHARKQYLQAVAENKDLLSAVDILKHGIVERDKQIEYYKTNLLRMTQQLQRGGSMVEVKQRLLEQLDQTQFMVNETYKKWSHSDIGVGLNGFHDVSANSADDHGGERTAWVVQLDEYVGRLEVICDRWREYVQQSRDLQRRYGDAWRSAALSFGRGKERPSWVDDVERKCSSLITESVRVSEAMRDVVEDVVNVLQRSRSSVERKSQRRSRSKDPLHRRSTTRDRSELSPLRENNLMDDALSLEHFHGDLGNCFADRQNGNNSNDHDVLFMNRGKRVSSSTSRGGGSSRPSFSRGGTSAIFGHSLTSLGRIGDELKAIEKKIKTYPDE